MFFGAASEAMALYQSEFDEFKIQEMQKYGDSAGEIAGKIQIAKVKFADHDGKVFMPLDNYGFSPRFGWVQDRLVIR
jgi:predicted 3-demethylubiquinone-9 3-methyltransferase (glyoxalase superfamily)